MDWSEFAMVAGTFGAALGTSLGGAIANGMRRKTIDNAVADKTQPLRAQNASQEDRIAALEAAVFAWVPRKNAPPVELAAPAAEPEKGGA